MRIILMHNPKAGRGNHAKRDLMAALAKAGHQAIYQSTKKNNRYVFLGVKSSANRVIAT